MLKTLPVRFRGAVADKEVEATGIGNEIAFCLALKIPQSVADKYPFTEVVEVGIERIPEFIVRGEVRVIVPVAAPRERTPALLRVTFPVKAPPPFNPVPASTWVELGVMPFQNAAEEIYPSAPSEAAPLMSRLWGLPAVIPGA